MKFLKSDPLYSYTLAIFISIVKFGSLTGIHQTFPLSKFPTLICAVEYLKLVATSSIVKQ